MLFFDLQHRVHRETDKAEETRPSATLDTDAMEARAPIRTLPIHVCVCVCEWIVVLLMWIPVLPELGGWQFIAIYHPVASNAAARNQTAKTELVFLRHVT